MTPHQTGAVTDAAAEVCRPAQDAPRHDSLLPTVPRDRLEAESGSWLLLVPAGTCLVLMVAALLGWG